MTPGPVWIRPIFVAQQRWLEGRFVIATVPCPKRMAVKIIDNDVMVHFAARTKGYQISQNIRARIKIDRFEQRHLSMLV